MEITQRFEEKDEPGWVCPLTEDEKKEILKLCDAEDGCCTARFHSWFCVRGENHAGPHVATGDVDIYAIWD